MHDLVRTAAAALVGALTASAVLAGPPALAGVEGKAKKITSAMIKDGTIRRGDLNADVRGSLAKADTALQTVPRGSVGTGQLDTGAVTSDKLGEGAVEQFNIAEGSVGPDQLASDAVRSVTIQDGSVTTSDIKDDTIIGADIDDGALRLRDFAAYVGTVTHDFPNLATGSCAVSPTVTTAENLDQAIILVENQTAVSGAVQLHARQAAAGSSMFEIVACNVGATFNPPSATFTVAVLRGG